MMKAVPHILPRSMEASRTLTRGFEVMGARLRSQTKLSLAIVLALANFMACGQPKERLSQNSRNPYNSNASPSPNDQNSEGKDKNEVPPQTPAGGQEPPKSSSLSVSVSLSSTPISSEGNSEWPRAVRRANGELVLVYNQDIEGFHTLRTEVSRDNGRTWEALGEVIREAIANGVELRDASLLLLPSGTILAVYRFIKAGVFTIQTSQSTDGGLSWALQGVVDTGGLNMLHPTLRISSKGQVQAYYSKEKIVGGLKQIVMKSSKDEGKTWDNETIVASKLTTNASFPGVATLADGSVLVVYDTPRSSADSHLILQYSQSNNEGLTWSEPSDLYIPANGQRSAKSPQISLLSDGRPMVFFMTDEDSSPDQCCSVKIVLGEKPGGFKDVSWLPQPIAAVSGPFTRFPSGVLTDDDDFLLFYERSGKVQSNRLKVGEPE